MAARRKPSTPRNKSFPGMLIGSSSRRRKSSSRYSSSSRSMVISISSTRWSIPNSKSWMRWLTRISSALSYSRMTVARWHQGAIRAKALVLARIIPARRTELVPIQQRQRYSSIRTQTIRNRTWSYSSTLRPFFLPLSVAPQYTRKHSARWLSLINSRLSTMAV